MDFDAASLGFSAEYDKPIRYIDRTHRWYDALGYGNPYHYAHFSNAPFSPLAKPLSACRVAIITTAAL